MDLDRIYCGDAYKLIREIPDKSVDLIVTDPPYDIVGLHNITKFKRSYLTQLSDLKLGRHYLGFEIDCRTFNIAVDRCNGITPYERKISDDGQMSLF